MTQSVLEGPTANSTSTTSGR